MKIKFIIISLIILKLNLLGQKASKEYYFYIGKADSFLLIKDYEAAGIAYSTAFKTLGNKGHVEDRYNAARVWALANIPDSAFDCLERIIVKNNLFSDYEMLKTQLDFKNIISDKRWNSLTDQLKKNDSVFKSKIRKRNTDTITTVILKNNLGVSVSVYWIDNSYDEIFYFSIDPHQEKFQSTYIGHEWVVREIPTSVKVAKFEITKKYPRFNLYRPLSTQNKK